MLGIAPAMPWAAIRQSGSTRADRVDAPLHLAVEIVALEGQPVEALGIGGDLHRRLDVVPLGIRVAMPDAGQRVEVAVFRPQPDAERRPWPAGCSPRRRRSCTRSRRRSRSAPGGPCSGWRARCRKAPAASATSGSLRVSAPAPPPLLAKPPVAAETPMHRGERPSVGADLAGVGELAHGPVGDTVDQLGDDGADAILSGEVELAVVVRPVVYAGAALDRAPHEPVAEDVQPVLAGGSVVTLPILARRVGLAEVDGPEGNFGKHAGGILRR